MEFPMPTLNLAAKPTNALIPQLTSSKVPLDMSPHAFGELRASTDIASDPEALQARIQEDGYLYLPGYLDRQEVIEVRHELIRRLTAAGIVAADDDPAAAKASEGSVQYFSPQLANDNEVLLRLLYAEDGRVMSLYRKLLGGAVRHYDFTWMRTVSPGGATQPHCDIVYMGRGTPNVFTAWIPYSDISWEVGGLMVLEKSNHNKPLRETYGKKDVDEWCSNLKPAYEGMGRGGNIDPGGRLSDNPATLREELGGRWLSAQFRMGDLLTFPMYTVHGSLDNHSREVRLSSDTRYQLASEPADERWIGENPPGHGPSVARGVIC
jgi:ectoine hydroxylase-related dioxygenase (phytanoyl-CoA dioxygenase family)